MRREERKIPSRILIADDNHQNCELIDAYLAATASLRVDQRDAIFKTTANRVYRLRS